jgi:hypothetical protein
LSWWELAIGDCGVRLKLYEHWAAPYSSAGSAGGDDRTRGRAHD